MSKRPTEREFLNGNTIGGNKPFFLIAGPCVMESRDLLDRVAGEMIEICKKLGIFYIFKSSFDKANRSSVHSYRGPGLHEGIKNLEYIKSKYGIPVLTDIHEVEQVEPLKDVIDVYQIPAFLSRQTDLLEAAAKTGKWVNVKKGQFLAPADCKHIKEKIRECGSEKYLVTERGASFGYNNLVFDLRVIPILHSLDIPIIFDGTHSAQLPGGAGNITGGQREFIPDLMTGAVSLGVEGLFMEVHPDPPSAKSDSTTQFYLNKAEKLITNLYKLDRLVKTELVELES
ncbi:MAG TPA: 3-deoxy-8-phosphooctulonate synthase [Leptospiraceae bacterium]|nr:3-deoxy-8-phosphooctulonate synthase [Leptospiraceae bacterium]HMW06817.1 3-deoxy-8-phosphooctulonate synthase [Leptospiraceae bacterium]HMX32166.1 3-deoxy-8-phosphooctulonate synthase [Leptospiraceae bacterium]HMY32236.1 3-deoxy-8-phosphooctulonate synthase [Leptospiraceae bacterium]HMZ63926.1 3-deoxy-8-phosphooctulonate synthase [Leptospiraceae bacterium]